MSERVPGEAMTSLCTVGYEGRTTQELLHILLENDVEVVVDVREVAWSRKKGFSKSALSAVLADAGVEYVHVRELGNPKALRSELKAGRAFREVADEFLRILRARVEALDYLDAIASRKRACLLCFEADPMTCHRSLVAQALRERHPVDVVHLGYPCDAHESSHHRKDISAA
jgi:uncharacterized protein (DUF488 family)